MSGRDDETAEKGAPGATHADLAASVAAIAGELARPDGDQLDLIDGSPDLDGRDGLAKAANSIAAERRGRGRPPGSANKRNAAVFDYLEALGHRDPAVTLSMIQTADTKELARALGLDSAKGRAAVFATQVRAAEALMPFKYARKPQQLELPPGAGLRSIMVIGEVNGTIVQGGDGFMSAGGGEPKKPNEINGHAVRDSEPVSHDDGNASDISDLDDDRS